MICASVTCTIKRWFKINTTKEWDMTKRLDKETGSLKEGSLYKDIAELIAETRHQVAQVVNQALVLLYWQIGRRVHQEVLQSQRADYGKEIVNQLSTQLTAEFGPGFTRTNLFNMLRFAEVYPDQQIVHTLCGQLGWSHFRQLIYIEDPLKRQFYTEIGRHERWSSRTLGKKIEGMLFERTAISRKPEKLIQKELDQLAQTQKLTTDLVFRDPYVLNFLHLPSQYSETDFESAILSELCAFIQEFGTDFCFVARQKRITIDHEDYAIDLLFFHRGLRRLIALELKLGKFTAAHKGQMELYLRWLDKYERREGEERPLGLILCSEKKQEHIELLELDRSGIHVAQYLTELPPRALLEMKLHDAIRMAREKVSYKEISDQDADNEGS